MKYLEEGNLLNDLQKRYHSEIYQNNSIKNGNNYSGSSVRRPYPQRLQLQRSYVLPLERPLKSPLRFIGNSVPNGLYHYTIENSPKSSSNSKLNNKSIFILGDLVNVYNGFVHRFTNENSSIRAYKTIGHTTLSFASIISMKNRPLLDRRVINESNIRKKRELQERQIRAQEQKKKKNGYLKERVSQRNMPLVIDTVHKRYQKPTSPVYEYNNNVDQDIKVEILRTLSVSESSRLSSESLESLKSLDYVKIEDIIDEYLVTPSAPIVPIRYQYDQDHLNSLNHLYDAFNYFNDNNLRQYVAWIPLNHNKGCLSASSLLSKKHAPIVFKKTITLPKRISSLCTANGFQNEEAKKIESSTPQKEPPMTIKEEPVKKKPSKSNRNRHRTRTRSKSNKPSISKNNTAVSIETQVAEALKNSKSSKITEEQKNSNTSTKPSDKKITLQESKLEIKLIAQENNVEIKLKPESQSSKSNFQEFKLKVEDLAIPNPKIEMESKSKDELVKGKPNPQKNITELKNKIVKKGNSKKTSSKKRKSHNKKKSSKIPILHNSNIDLSSIKIGDHRNTTVPIPKLNTKTSKIPVIGKFEFPFYHMYDAFETYGKSLLKAPRAWRQLKRNVVSIASIYSYDNRP